MLITIVIIVTLMFHSFLTFLAKLKNLPHFSLYLIFNSVVWHDGKIRYTAITRFFIFLLIIIRSDLLPGIRWSLCIEKSLGISCASFSKMDSGLCIYNLAVWSNFNFLHKSQIIIFPSQPWLAIYSFSACVSTPLLFCDELFRLHFVAWNTRTVVFLYISVS